MLRTNRISLQHGPPMKTHTTSTCIAVAAALLGTGCAQASAKQTQAPAPAASTSAQASGPKPAGAAPAPAPGGEKKSLASVVKPMKKNDGLFAIYQDTTNGSLMMSISKDKIGREFIYFTHVVDAPVAVGAFRGAFGTNNVFTVQKHFNRLEFVTQNPSFWFDNGHALARAAYNL